MLAQTWPPVAYWLEADDQMVATAVAILEDQHPDPDDPDDDLEG